MYTDVLTWYWYYNNQKLVGFVQYMLDKVNTCQEEKFASPPFSKPSPGLAPHFFWQVWGWGSVREASGVVYYYGNIKQPLIKHDSVHIKPYSASQLLLSSYKIIDLQKILNYGFSWHFYLIVWFQSPWHLLYWSSSSNSHPETLRGILLTWWLWGMLAVSCEG